MAKGANGLTHRQERFCRAFAAGFNGTRAATSAGYMPIKAGNHAWRLLRQPRIRARIAAIQADMAREACEGTAVLLGKLESIFRAALEDRHYQAAARAVDLQAKFVRLAAMAAGRVAEESAQAVDSAEENGKMRKNEEEIPVRNRKIPLFIKTCQIPARP